MPFETTVLPDVAPGARDAPPFWEPEPTQAMDALELEREQKPEAAAPQPFGRSVFPEGTELLAEQPAATPERVGPPPGETGPVSALDALFGESQFKEYTGGPDPNESPFARRADPPPTGPPGAGGAPAKPAGPPPRITKLQKILLIVLGAMLAVIVLIALFFIGMRLPALFGPAPAVTVPSSSPSPSASPGIVVGPVAPGTYRYDELLGGECLEPFESAWQDEYTVVACDQPHHGQLVRIAEFPVPETGPEPYPGEEELQTRALQLCRAGSLYSSGAAGLPDVVITATYPLSEEEWDAGERSYSCFVNRSSGEPLPGDVAAPQPTPSPTAVP